MRKLSLFVSFMLLTAASCSSNGGKCKYDTDCAGPCERCNSQGQCYVDTDCSDIQKGRCKSDADCDPLFEKCVNQNCVPRYDEQDGGTDGGDLPADGDYIGGDTEYCKTICNGGPADCSRPQSETACSQGKDVDRDDWGECCDCDERSAAVNPSRREIIYNCRDDDCNSGTPDDDLDGDGYGSILRGCNPGSDCNDADKTIHPNAAEICDNKDNNCDGRVDIDPETSRTVCGGVECADVSGHYYITPNCAPYFTSQDEIDIAQNGCNIYFTVQHSSGETLYCTGAMDPSLNLDISCSGIFGAVCKSKVSLGSSWIIDCGQGGITCTFEMSRQATVTSCSYFNDPKCTALGQNCGAVCSGGGGIVACVAVNPGGKQPGFFCDSNLNIACINDFCHENVCTSACRNDADCASFSGTACRAISYADCGTALNINGCVPREPGETSCRRTSDCQPGAGKRCTVRQDLNDVVTVCRSPVGSKVLGAECLANSECQSGLCICGTMPCSGGTGKCSEACMGSSDCPSGSQCGVVSFLDLNNNSHQVQVCTWTTSGCARDADCPQNEPVCSPYYNDTQTAIITECNGANPNIGESNPGASCRNWIDCWSLWCIDWQQPSYCGTLCASDADCPVFEQEPSKSCPQGDSDCELGYLCIGGLCKRQFRCWAMVFPLPGLPDAVDAVDVCQPTWKQCETDRDCRAGEACKLGYNRDASEALYVCQQQGPGTGELGAKCEENISEDCRTSLCIFEGGGGPGKQYCSKACVVDADCKPDVDPTYDYRCGPINVTTPFGYDMVPACVRK